MTYSQTPFKIEIKNIPTLQSLENKSQKDIGSILWNSIDNKKELKVRTLFCAVQSCFQTKPEIFKILLDIAFEMVQC
jgi:hypothetical protein